MVRRQIEGGRPWLGWMVNVVEDTPEQLVTYSPEGSRFHFCEGDWPTPDGLHPWHAYGAWTGHGALMLQRPGDPYAVWHFWGGQDREFQGWYVNLETPFSRTEIGFDTEDLELDIMIKPDGNWDFKDVDKLWESHGRGRYTRQEVERILALGNEIGAMIDSGDWWWDRSWTEWQPDPGWGVPEMPDGWADVPSEF